MRVAQISPLDEAVPPKCYGGTERIVSYLTEALVDLGHDVTLFASGDSVTRANLVPVLPSAIRHNKSRVDRAAAEAALLKKLLDMIQTFDIIHCHLDWMHLPLLSRLSVPFLTTLHGRLDYTNLRAMAPLFPDAPFVSISHDQRRPLSDLNWIGTIGHGIPPDTLQPGRNPEGYLAFLGRIAPEKGPDVAIRLAHAAGMPLRIAAKIPSAEGKYFREHIEPAVDGARVRFVGEVSDREKNAFLGQAAALLFPIRWPEPFGLVMIEAMACGTPVIAFRRGSVAEVLEHGVTGFVVDTEREALEAIRRLGELDRGRVRERFERRFTDRRMVDDYLRLYRRLATPGRSEKGLGRKPAGIAALATSP